jgi:ribosomal protein S18 acetylase RimI-like enzyme
MSETSGYRIREAVVADRPAIEALVLRAFHTAAPPWATKPGSEVEWLVWVGNYFTQPLDGQFILVADGDDGTIWGTAHVMGMTDPLSRGPHPHLESLAVAPHAEGRGVASALIATCGARVRETGARELTLHVYVGNARAQAVYERQGFVPEWLRMRLALDADDATSE